MDKPFKFTLPPPNFNKNAKDAGKHKPHFLTPSGMSLLPREKQPPPMYGKHGATVPPKYFPQHATSQQFEESPVKQYCEPCELELQSLEDLKRHRSQHEKCPVEGCLYKGHPTVMDKHINALHASGLFDKFKKLSTPEEIAAWRAERKKRYPTLANIVLKQKAKEQRQKRGERLEASKNRFGKVNDRQRAQSNQKEAEKGTGEEGSAEAKQHNQRNNKRNRKNKRNQKSREPKVRQEVKKELKEIEACKEESIEITCGGVKMFKGTGQMKNYKRFEEKRDAPVQNALFSLVGMYGSDDDSMEERESENDCDDVTEVKDKIFENCPSVAIENDAICNDNLETLQNEKTEKYSVNIENSNDITALNIEKSENKTLSNEIKGNIKEQHELAVKSISKISSEEKLTKEILNNDHSGDVKENSSDEAPLEEPIQRNIPDYPVKSEKVPASQKNEEPLAKRSKTVEEPSKEKKFVAKRKFGLDYRRARLRKQNTMLEKLLETDIRHERNVLLQCVRYVCENNYFGIGQINNQIKPD